MTEHPTVPPASRPARSYLYAPGDRPDLLRKALAGPADVVVADLEDAVPADRKEAARTTVTALLAEPTATPLHVRVNPVATALGREDLRALASAAPSGTVVRLPKVDGPASVLAAVELLGFAGRTFGISGLIESAAGVEQAAAIAAAHPWVVGISLGEADLAADLGVAADALDAGLAYARSRIVVAARAARLGRPALSVYTRLRDLEGLERSSRAGRAAGFFGRSAIHPAQVDVINRVFLPSEAELADARALVRALADGDGNAVLADGRYVDAAVAEAARWTLAWDQDTTTEEQR